MKSIYHDYNNCLHEIIEGYIPIKEKKVVFDPPINCRIIECATPHTFKDGEKYEEGIDYKVEEMNFMTNPPKKELTAYQIKIDDDGKSSRPITRTK